MVPDSLSRLELLSRSAARLIETADQDQLTSVLSNVCREVFDPAALLVVLRLRSTSPFVVACAFDHGQALDHSGISPFLCDLPEALRKGESILLPPDGDQFLEHACGISLSTSSNTIYSPMCFGGEVLGIIAIHAGPGGAYGPEHLVQSQILAAVAASTLRRITVQWELGGSEDRYRRIIAQANAVPYERDFKSGDLRSIGEGLEALTGYPPEEAGLARTWKKMVRQIVMRGDAAKLSPQEAVGKIRQGELKLWKADYRLARRDGTEIWVSDASLTLFDGNGQPYASFGILQDITERMRSEAFHMALSGLGEKIGAATTPREVAMVAMETADNLLGWDAAFVGTYSEDEDQVIAVLNLDVVNGERAEFPSTYDTGSPPSPMFRRVLADGPQLILRDAEGVPNPDEPESFRVATETRRAGSLMFVPMREKGTRNIGVFTIQSYAVRAYSEKDLEVLQVLADYCGSALARTNAEERLRKSEALTKALSALSFQLNSTTTPEEAGEVIAEAADRIFGWDAFLIWLYQPKEDSASVLMMYDIVDGRRQRCTPADTRSSPTPAVRRAVGEGAFLILRDAATQADTGTIVPFGAARRSNSLMYAPARTREGVTGIISVQSYTERAYTQDSLATLQALADGCGGAFERLWFEKALWEERQMLRTLIDSIPDAVYVKDTDGHYVVSNLAHQRAVGAGSQDEILGTSASDWYPLDLAENYIAADRALLQTGEPIIEHEEKSLGNARQDLIIVSTTKVPLRDQAGRITGLVGINRDITENRRVQKRLLVFAELIHKLSATTTPRQAGRVIVSAAQELIGWDSCFLVQYAEETNHAHPLFNVDTVDGQIVEVALEQWEGAPVGYTLKTIQEGKQLVLRSTEEVLPPGSYKFGNQERRSESLMFVPIRDQQHVIGVLSIQSYKADAYKESDLDLLQNLADHCSEALARIQAQDATRITMERFALATRGTNDGVWDWDLVRNQVYYSTRWKSIIGYDEPEVGTSPEEWLDRIHQDDAERVRQELQAHMEGQTKDFSSEFRMRHRNGEYVWVLCRGQAVCNADGKAVRVAGSLTDISERHAFQEQLTKAAFYDPLTGLANRALFMDRLGHCLSHTRRNKNYRFAVLFMDLDRFKLVNDSLGHLVGDKLLKEIGVRLVRQMRGEDTVARLGGDEFTILMEDLRSPRDAIRVAERILREIAEPFAIEGSEIFSSTSIGITIGSGSYKSVEEVLRDADTALYRAKELGRGRYIVFDSKMHDAVLVQLDVENGLRNACRNNELRLHYQPILSLSSEAIIGFEALVRWQHPHRGLLPPAEFIPVAEETGLIIQLGEWVLREACRQMAKWGDCYPAARNLFISINLSPKQFGSPGLGQLINDVLKENGLNPASLHLEITENAILKEPEKVKPMLDLWRKTGIRVLLDDFGTGYSPLTNLTTYPVDFLKIDRSFVSSMSSSPGSVHIVRAVVSLARILEISVIAEGAETAEQVDALRNIGCDLVQGYFIAHPMDADKAEMLIAGLPIPPDPETEM